MESNSVLTHKPEKESQAEDAERAFNTVLARMVRLSETALKADSIEKAGHIIVNRINTLVKTERSVIVPLKGKRRVLCISGDLEPSDDNPFSQAIHEIRKAFRDSEEPRVLNREVVQNDIQAPEAKKVLESMGGTQILWLPIPSPGGGESQYALWLERWNSRAWTPEEIRLLSHSLVFFGHALNAGRKRKTQKKSGKRALVLALVLFLAILWIPIHSWVSAPVQIVPDHPHYVFAPFDGIVEELAVQPGEKVSKGDLIFRYDTRVLEQRLEEAQRGVAVAIAELARLEGAAYADEEARARIPVQKLEVQRKQAEVTFIEKQLDLSEVKTEVDGVVVLDDPDALIGASLQTGQMILRVADPNRTKLRIMVPVTDAGLVREDAQAMIRLDSDPLHVFPAVVSRIGFDVQLSEERIPSVMVEALWEKEVSEMPGQRGTARIQGPQVFLGVQMFRKPLAGMRTMLGI